MGNKMDYLLIGMRMERKSGKVLSRMENHKGQKDKAKKPYILHPLRLMMSVDTDEEKIVAVMHDIVEDSEISLDDLRNEGFSDEILSAIECVTKKDGEDYDAFIERIAQNPLAIKVKLADLEDNMDLTRLSKVTEKDLERVEKYKLAKQQLLNA
jgi:(p)ppGpp synthase/HD superfamily hydrolase|tara:strand:- start:361 stop:822 length:462 start_codon:yes stop_codon:yes gene_type:complete